MSRFAGFNLTRCGRINLLTAFLLCFSGSAFAQPHVAKEADVQGCQYLNEIEGVSGYGKNANWQALAKYSALNRAEKLAATHVVWTRLEPAGGFNGVAVAKAYRCN